MNIEKLKHLWKNRKATINADSMAAIRVDKLYEMVENWEGNREAITKLRVTSSPYEKDIPKNFWPEVKRRMDAIKNGNEPDRYGWMYKI